MKYNGFVKALGHAIDPRRDFEKEIPRPFLLAKYTVEYLFRLAGFFILLCFIVALTLASCTQNFLLQLFPLVLAIAFFFYIAMTTLGIPVFLAIGEINNTIVRRTFGYVTVIIMLVLTVYSVFKSPIFEILETYVSSFFPSALECRGGIIELKTP